MGEETQCQKQVNTGTEQKTGSWQERAKGTGFPATGLGYGGSLSSMGGRGWGKKMYAQHIEAYLLSVW